jgi:tetratricopeptide (TPR) repeat protein
MTLLVAVVALICGSRALPAETIGDPVATRSAEAREHYDAGRYEESLRAYRDALVERPHSGALHLNVGDALYQLGEYEDALQEFDRAAAQSEGDLAARGLYNKGNTHFQLQDYAAAVEAYKGALERSPRDTDAKANLELALQMLQTPPPESQQGDDESEDAAGEEQQESSEGESSEGEDSAESGKQEDESPGEQPPGEQQPSPPDEGEEETADDGDGGQTKAEEAERMDEDEAEQLLDALNDRDAQSQQRRYRAKHRGDDVRDW